MTEQKDTERPRRKRLMVSAYACEPGKGSEIGVGWHWVLELSRAFDLWVLTRANNRPPIHEWVTSHPDYKHIHFVYFDLPERDLRRKHGIRGVHRYYLKWTRKADAVIARVMADNDIPNFLHLTYGNALWPVSAVGAKANFIWGPLGGLETISGEYSRRYSLRSRITEAIRRVAARFVPHTPAFKRRCKAARLIICKTEITRDKLPSSCREKSVVMTDVAADTTNRGKAIGKPNDTEAIHALMVGKMDAWRGFDLAIEAVAMARSKGVEVTLSILGNGADKARLRKLTDRLGIADYVTFHGHLSMEQYQDEMAKADVVLNPALREGAVTVAYDAIAAGKPLVAIDTRGYTRNFSSDHCIILPQGTRRDTVLGLADALGRLRVPAVRHRMGAAALRHASEVSWSRHGEAIRALFDSVLI
ncbi:MAG: glycosyltransferase family 4 protein [Candidatus Amulumruptor caecigallinarius]|nr:glycosyltransferase family 4 protein [Candidatus Amulumruptor caecigallinarius]MCM1396280.1 glycosyltransferase family 4 protein [Candidatus Amulumruptor caecigallinarius]MCM1454274.1 glycosyltransferase family 4 protein [bacterium]